MEASKEPIKPPAAKIPGSSFHPRMDKESLAEFRKQRMGKARAVYQSRSWELLSDAGDYKNKDSPIAGICENGHLFASSWSNAIRLGSGCATCWDERRGKARRAGIEKPMALVESRGGKLHSEEYVDEDWQLEIECPERHPFRMTYSNLQKGCWCPDCQSSVAERVCRSVLERTLGETFPKKKPPWLRNEHDSRLELDGYSETLKAAFEYNGKQHYEPVKHFDRRGDDSFAKRIKHDRIKRLRCGELGIRLIVVPYNVPIPEIAAFLRKECERLGLLQNRPDANFMVQESDIFIHDGIKRFRQIVVEKGGRVLSTIYSLGEHVLLECADGHRWSPIPYYIAQGRWCPKCACNARWTMADIQKAISERGIECLNKNYKNMRIPMRWRCKKCGHQWPAVAYQVIGMKTGCPVCAGSKRGASQRKTIEDCRMLALENGGECLSEEYENNRKNLQFRCLKEGHVFWRSYEKAAAGRWCSVCRGTRTIEGQNSQSGRKENSVLKAQFSFAAGPGKASGLAPR